MAAASVTISHTTNAPVAKPRSAVHRFATTTESGSGFVTPLPRTTPAGGGGGEGCVDPPL